jgi:hypothetical protein
VAGAPVPGGIVYGDFWLSARVVRE